MRNRLLIFLFLIKIVLETNCKELKDYEMRETSYFKVSTGFYEIGSTDYMAYITSQVLLKFENEINDSLWSDLVSKKSTFRYVLKMDWKGNVYGIVDRTENLSKSLQQNAISKIIDNEFFIPLVSQFPDWQYIKTREILDGCVFYVPISINPQTTINFSKQSPYYLQQVPDSLITKDVMLKLSKEILAIPLKESHRFDSLININPKNEDGFNN